MNPLTVAQFRTDYPEFGDTSKYPDALVAQCLPIAALQVGNTARWGALLTTGQELVTAHYVTLAARNRAAAATGATPGTTQGLATAQAVGPISASYDFAATTYEDAGGWNQTSYGQRYFQLVRLIGAGGYQLSQPFCLGEPPCF